ncbi:MAG: hypothetical protein K2K63_04065 [Acetatifactor sp.]|nr:hypothetical protein [Acetatifactor sp.]
MNRIKTAACIAALGLWLLALIGGLWFAGVISFDEAGGAPAAVESTVREGDDGPRVWKVVFKGMQFTLQQKGTVYLHGSGCMNIRQDERYLIQIQIGVDTLDEMWARMEEKRESLIAFGYRMEKEAERLTGEGHDYVRYVISLEEERGSDLDRTYFEVMLAPADEGRHFLVVIPFDKIDVEKLDETMREKIYDEALVRAREVLDAAYPTDEIDDEVGMLWTEDKSLDPEQRYISEDTIVYGNGQHSLSYVLPDHCMLTADTIAGKTYYDEDNQVYIMTSVVKYTWMTAEDMKKSAADRELSRIHTEGEVQVNGRTFYYYTYSVLEYKKMEASTTYCFHAYCDLEDGSIYTISGFTDDYPGALEEIYYLEWMDISVS